MDQPTHLAHIFQRNARDYPQDTAIRFRKNHRYLNLSWAEVWERILQTAQGLKNVGVQANSKVAIWSNNRPEWVFSDMGALCLGAASVPVYVTLAASEIQHILNNSAARVLVVENETLLKKLDPILHELDQVWGIVLMEGAYKVQNPRAHQKLYSFEDWTQPLSPHDRQALEARLEGDHTEETATLIYTSGTTNTPKGVILTHGNFIANMSAIAEALPFSHHDTHLSFLPLCHVFERLCGYYLMVYTRIAVPRFYEKLYIEISYKMMHSNSVIRHIFLWAVKIGKQTLQARRQNKNRSLLLTLQHAVADRLVFRKIRQIFGGKIQFGISGGAPLRKDIAEFFLDVGIELIEGYGLTETSPVISLNRRDKNKFGTVGIPLNNVEVRISPEGEIVTRGPCVMKGYYHDPKATQEVIRDGWFYTGDLGEIDDDGFLKITGRLKETIVLSGGKKVFPSTVEAIYEKDPNIERCFLYGEGKNFITALIMPHMELLEKKARQAGVTYQSRAKLSQSSWAHDLIHDAIHEIGNSLAPFKQIKYFKLLEQDFTIEAGELTPTMKVRRKVVCQKYGSLLEPHYSHKTNLDQEA